LTAIPSPRPLCWAPACVPYWGWRSCRFGIGGGKRAKPPSARLWRTWPHSDHHLRAHFHHPIARNAEVLGGLLGAAPQPDKEPFLPARHFRLHCGLERAAGEEKGGRGNVDIEVFTATVIDDLRHARRLHEAVMRDHTNEGVGDAIDLDALVPRHAWGILG